MEVRDSEESIALAQRLRKHIAEGSDGTGSFRGVRYSKDSAEGFLDVRVGEFSAARIHYMRSTGQVYYVMLTRIGAVPTQELVGVYSAVASLVGFACVSNGTDYRFTERNWYGSIVHEWYGERGHFSFSLENTEERTLVVLRQF